MDSQLALVTVPSVYVCQFVHASVWQENVVSGYLHVIWEPVWVFWYDDNIMINFSVTLWEVDDDIVVTLTFPALNQVLMCIIASWW